MWILIQPDWYPKGKGNKDSGGLKGQATRAHRFSRQELRRKHLCQRLNLRTRSMENWKPALQGCGKHLPVVRGAVTAWHTNPSHLHPWGLPLTCSLSSLSQGLCDQHLWEQKALNLC